MNFKYSGRGWSWSLYVDTPTHTHTYTGAHWEENNLMKWNWKKMKTTIWSQRSSIKGENKWASIKSRIWMGCFIMFFCCCFFYSHFFFGKELTNESPRIELKCRCRGQTIMMEKGETKQNKTKCNAMQHTQATQHNLHKIRYNGELVPLIQLFSFLLTLFFGCCCCCWCSGCRGWLTAAAGDCLCFNCNQIVFFFFFFLACINNAPLARPFMSGRLATECNANGYWGMGWLCAWPRHIRGRRCSSNNNNNSERGKLLQFNHNAGHYNARMVSLQLHYVNGFLILLPPPPSPRPPLLSQHTA